VAENEDRSSEDLGEEISQHRLEEFRERGQVAQSRELTALLALMAVAATTYALSPKMGAQMSDFMQEVFRTDLSARIDLSSTSVSHELFRKAIGLIVTLGLPICLAGFVMGVVGSFIQVGSIFSVEAISPSLEKVDPIAGFKRLFSMKQGVEAIRLLLKTVVLVLVSYWLVKYEILRSAGFAGTELSDILPIIASISKTVFLTLFGILTVFAVIDFGMQKWEMNKQLRMTKQEARQEHKEREGDPMIKARIRAIQREVSRKRMMQAVKKATVVITNPTHIAIAIYYDKDTMAAPKVVAKGADFVAQRIKKIAAEAGVPMVENVPLARTLYKTVKLNQAIPRALYQAVAEVLAYVYRLKNRGW
jgi:flagellar biosynthetic protein FlhB